LKLELASVTTLLDMEGLVPCVAMSCAAWNNIILYYVLMAGQN